MATDQADPSQNLVRFPTLGRVIRGGGQFSGPFEITEEQFNALNKWDQEAIQLLAPNGNWRSMRVSTGDPIIVSKGPDGSLGLIL